MALREPSAKLPSTQASKKLLVYSTGATIEFADRREIKKIVEAVSKENHGLRSLIHAAVQSNIFLSK